MARQVLITGVTGGIGGALAESFTANGDMVIGIGRRRDKLTALRDRLGESFDSLQADLETVEGSTPLWTPWASAQTRSMFS